MSTSVERLPYERTASPAQHLALGEVVGRPGAAFPRHRAQIGARRTEDRLACRVWLSIGWPFSAWYRACRGHDATRPLWSGVHNHRERGTLALLMAAARPRDLLEYSACSAPCLSFELGAFDHVAHRMASAPGRGRRRRTGSVPTCAKRALYCGQEDRNLRKRLASTMWRSARRWS